MLTLARPANRPQRITSNQTSDRWRKKRLQRLQFVFIPSSWFQFFCAGVTLTSDFLLLPSISSLLVSLPPHCASLPPPSSLRLPPGSGCSVWWGDDKTTSPPLSPPPRWIVPQRLCHSKLLSGEIEASSLFFSFQGFSLSAEAVDRFRVQPAGIVLFIKNPVTVKHLWYRVEL